MAFTSSDLVAVERAIASGELSVSNNGRSVTYRSMLDLVRARDMIRAELDKAASRGATNTFGGRSYGLARFD
ncbi:hypothetical protein QTH87_05940 [Variovorax sp. J22P168]|uniref:phage head-tail joining protein n=1 Tax=Variovorax jilinensis TaxID=3053513 RepID=UPI002577028C|nr:hypothetical protein [Variovorax sp. J22P168]MDM0011979.1 hypothetical protein [Variovorax sp. J22P168]